MKGKEMKGSCCSVGVCHKCSGGKWVLLGVLLLLNSWAMMAGKWSLSWPVFVGVLVVLKGLMLWVMPHCPHCE